MNEITANNRPVPVIHPLILTTYSVLAFLAYNIEEVSILDSSRPLLFSLSCSSIVYLVLKSTLQNRHRAGFLTSFLLLLFFTYGHVYEYLESLEINGLILGRHRYLLIIWFFMMLLGALWSKSAWASSANMTNYLNVISAFALLFPIIQIGGFGIRVIQSKSTDTNLSVHNFSSDISEFEYLPDIYYIILDGYSRDDILNKYYQLDNRTFLNQLEDRGFFIAYCSQSNYAQTQLSLATSLNFNYLNNLGDQFTPQNTSRIGLPPLIKDNFVRNIVESAGYEIIALDSGYEPTRWKDADVYYSPDIVQDINDFEERFIRTTLARVVVEGITILDIPPDWEKRDQAHRERILFALDKLLEIPSISRPKFIFAHIISPHWPHVFGPEGEPVHEHNDSITGYRNQVVFMNRRIIPIIETIKNDSPVPPIIIIQGDHGSVIESPERRMSILNAYYLPGGKNNLLYEGISPVNTFRVIFNKYFGTNYNLLDDVSLYSEYESPYSFQVINNSRPGCDF